MNRRNFFKGSAALLAAFALPNISAIAKVLGPELRYAVDLAHSEPTTVNELVAWFHRCFKPHALVPSTDRELILLYDPELIDLPAVGYYNGADPATWKLGLIITDEEMVEAGQSLADAQRLAEATLCRATYRRFLTACVEKPEIVGGPVYWRRMPEVYEPELTSMWEGEGADSVPVAMTASRHFLLRSRLYIPGVEFESKEGMAPDWIGGEKETGKQLDGDWAQGMKRLDKLGVVD